MTGKKLVTLTLIMLFVLALMGGVTLANDPEPPNWFIQGEWTGYSGEYTYDHYVYFYQDGGNIEGIIEVADGEGGTFYGTLEGIVEGDKVNFIRTFDHPTLGDRRQLKYEGLISSDGTSISGTVSTLDESKSAPFLLNGSAIFIDYTLDYPAAPAVAAQLLDEAGTSPRYGQGRGGGNFIANVAQFMSPGTMFDGVSKYNIEAYRCAVAEFLNNPEYHDGYSAEVTIPLQFNSVQLFPGWDKFETLDFGEVLYAMPCTGKLHLKYVLEGSAYPNQTMALGILVVADSPEEAKMFGEDFGYRYVELSDVSREGVTISGAHWDIGSIETDDEGNGVASFILEPNTGVWDVQFFIREPGNLGDPDYVAYKSKDSFGDTVEIKIK